MTLYRNVLIFLALSFSLDGYSQVVCGDFFARVDPQAGTLDYCPQAGNITFDALAGYQPDNGGFDPGLFVYSWLIDGTTYNGQQVTHFFSDPGAYVVSLTVEDPQNNCVAQVVEIVRLGTVPHFRGTMSTQDVACAGTPFSLVGVATPTIWTGFPTSVVETVPIPDGTGAFYESSLTFDIFDPANQIITLMDIDRICLRVEHVVQGQVQFELECPNGERVTLKDFSSGTANLGEPVVFDIVTPGLGYAYCFTPEPQFGTMDQTSPLFHEYTDQAGNYYFNAAYLPAGNYTPHEPLANLAGCPLNGQWTLRVRDNVPTANGFMFEWSLLFSEDFYPDSLIFSPQIVDEQWFRGNTPLGGNPSVVTIGQAGDHDFRYRVTDNFGCDYDTTLTVTILPLPQAEIISAVDMPLCEGDSTLLRVIPTQGSAQHWIYQWMLATADIPGAVYDTLMAGLPATYTVMVQDTLTGCSDFFDFQVSFQNCEITIPNVFTPNGDGINDLFEIVNLEHFPGAQIAIFNRWGKRVFEHSDYFGNWWDGSNHPDGVYFYVLTYTRLGERRESHGAVTIVR